MQRSLLCLSLAALATPALAQFTVTVPAGFASTVGNSNNTYPWSRGTASMRFQQVYDSSNWTVQGVNYPILISGMRFRPYAGAVTSWAGGSWPNIQIDLASCPNDFLAASTTFASNLGPDLTTVLTGPVTVTGGSTLGAGVVVPWHVDVPFTTPFVYDPTLGSDLTMDVYLDGTGWTGTSRGADVVSGTTAPNIALGSRIYSTAGIAATTGTVGLNHSLICEFTYVPAAGLYPSFSANVTTGNSPLSVNFTDHSYSSAPGGVLAWQWDFDGDSIVDSTLQNPTFVYNNCGTYNVSLTVVDAQYPMATLTKTGYVVVDQIAANFTPSANGGFAPATVNFTDTSTGPVAAWQWDFDGDNVIDSTVQNPSWIYGAPGTYTVSLTIVNACRTSTRTRTNLITVLTPGTIPAPPEILQYQFNEVRGQEVANTATTNLMPATGAVNTANWQADPGRAAFRGNEPGFGCLGDSNNTTATNLVSTTGPLNYSGSMTYSWWQRLVVAPPSTSYAFGGTGAGRIFTGGVGATSLTYRGALGTVNVDGTYNVQNNPGVWEHVCLVIDDVAGTGTWYFNGVPNTVQTFTPNTHVVAHPLATVGYNGTATTTNYTRNYDMDDFRIYSRALLAIEVQLLSLLPENATASATGATCPGTLGTIAIGTTGGAPTLGNASFAVTLGNAEDNRLAALVFGFAPATFGLFDLSPWIGAGCQLGTDPAAMNFYITAANSAQQGFAIPVDPSFAGLHVYAQWALLGTQGATSRLLDINLR